MSADSHVPARGTATIEVPIRIVAALGDDPTAYPIAQGPGRDGLPCRLTVADGGCELRLERERSPTVVVRLADLIDPMVAAASRGPDVPRAE